METVLIVLLLLFGTALMVVEFFMPGFGIPGISGIILLVAGIVFTFTNYGAIAGIISLLFSLVLCTFSIAISLRSASKGKLSQSALILKNEEKDGPEEDDLTALVGKKGTVLSVLRPAGTAEFDGVRLNVVSDAEFIEKGKPVRIVSVEGNRILVNEIK